MWSSLLAGGGSQGNVLSHASSYPSGLASTPEDYETVSVHSEPGGRAGWTRKQGRKALKALASPCFA